LAVARRRRWVFGQALGVSLAVAGIMGVGRFMDGVDDLGVVDPA